MKHAIYFLCAVCLFLAAVYCILWIFSSASLASGFCENHFSIFHKEFRCRQPYIALFLSLIFLAGTIIFSGLWLKGSK
jgi:hypothetical protein